MELQLQHLCKQYGEKRAVNGKQRIKKSSHIPVV